MYTNTLKKKFRKYDDLVYFVICIVQSSKFQTKILRLEMMAADWERDEPKCRLLLACFSSPPFNCQVDFLSSCLLNKVCNST